MLKARIIAAVLLAALGATACATRPPADDPAALELWRTTNDPIEPLNRAVFAFNDGVITYVIFPAAETYNVLPGRLRTSVSNASRNVKSPVTFANDILQGKGERAGITLLRFLINSLFGFGGAFDPAAASGIEGHSEDFGQTLATWGVGEGPYIVAPMMGPTTMRDAVGKGVDRLFDPLFWVFRAHEMDAARYARSGVSVLDGAGENIDGYRSLKNTSIDFYAAVRSAYRQARNAANGEADDADLPGFFFDCFKGVSQDDPDTCPAEVDVEGR